MLFWGINNISFWVICAQLWKEQRFIHVVRFKYPVLIQILKVITSFDMLVKMTIC